MAYCRVRIGYDQNIQFFFDRICYPGLFIQRSIIVHHSAIWIRSFSFSSSRLAENWSVCSYNLETIKKEEMGFIIRRRPAPIENPVEDLYNDVEELITTVLTCCQHRPSVYNEVSTVVIKLLSEVESRGKEIHPKVEDFDWFLPEESSCNSLVELQKDRNLLDKLVAVDIPQRPNVRSKLEALRDQIQSDIVTFNTIKIDKAKKTAKERDFDRAILAFILEKVSDRPHIHNRVVVELQKLQHEDSYKQRRQSRRRRRRRRRATTSAPLCWKKEEQPTALNRWEDVVRLDEIIDAVPETKLSLRELLVDLKDKCREEAKELQKVDVSLLQPMLPLQQKVA